MEDKLQILHTNLLKEGYDLPDYNTFKVDMSDSIKSKKLHDNLTGEGFDIPDYDTFLNDMGLKKKDISEDGGLPSFDIPSKIGQEVSKNPQADSITPKLPFQQEKKPKVSQEETFATEPTVTSVLQAQRKLPEYLKGEQDRIVEESTQAIKDELTKLRDNYQKKIEANPEKEKELKKQFDEEQNKVIDLRSANIPMAVESLYKKGKDYKWLDPADVKGLSEMARDIASKPVDFIQKRDALEGIKNNFMSKVGTLSPEEQSSIEKELNDVIAQSSVVNEKGVPSVFGWKSEVANKNVKVNQRIEELSKLPQTEETKTEYNLLYRAQKYYDRILKLPDDEGSFFEGFKSEGRNMLTAGMADLFDAANIAKISKKQAEGEPLSKGEQTLYDAYGVFQTAQNADQFGKAYERGKGIAGSVAFMESFALTGGLAGIGEKTALKMLGNQVKNKVVQNIAKGIGGAVVRTPLLTGGATETAKRIAGSPKLTETGEWKVDPSTIEPTMQAIGKGLYSNFANALGETAGGWLAGTKVSKFVGSALGINKIPKGVAKIFNTVGMQPLGELPEEYLTTLMETPVMGDQTLAEAFSPEAVWETAVQVGLMSGFFSGIALPSVINENAQRASNMKMIEIFGKDKVAEIRNAIENNDIGAYDKALKGLFNETNESQANIRLLVRYSNSLAQQKGARVAQEASKIANDETVVEQQPPNILEVGRLVNEEYDEEGYNISTIKTIAEEQKDTELLEAIKKDDELTAKAFDQNTGGLKGAVKDIYSTLRYGGQAEKAGRAVTKLLIKRVKDYEASLQNKPNVSQEAPFKIGDQSFATKEELFKHLDEVALDKETGKISTAWISQEEASIPNDATVKALNEWQESKNEGKNITTKVDLKDANAQQKVAQSTGTTFIGTQEGIEEDKSDSLDLYNVEIDGKPFTISVPTGSDEFAVLKKANAKRKEVSGTKTEESTNLPLKDESKSTLLQEEAKKDNSTGEYHPYLTKEQAVRIADKLGMTEEAFLSDAPTKLDAIYDPSFKDFPIIKAIKEEIGQKPPITTTEISFTPNKTIVKGYKELKAKLGEKKAIKYFQQVDRLFNPNTTTIVEYRENGVVTKEGDKYTFHALGDTDMKQWRDAWQQDVTDQFAPKQEVIKITDSITKTVTKSEPIAAYHRTDATFDAFDNSQMQKNDAGYAGKGFYFSTKPLSESAGKNLMKVSIDLKNPYVRTKENWKDDPLNPYTWIPKAIEGGMTNKEASAAWTKMMQEKGYDGFIDKAIDNGEIVAFSAEQIKVEKPAKDIPLSDNTETTSTEAISEEKPVVDTKVPPPPSKGVKEAENASEGGKRTGFEKRETEKGTKGSIEKRNDEIGQVVKRIVDDNPHFYKETTREDEIIKAQDHISSFANFNNAYDNLIRKTKDLDELTMRHVARQIMMQKLGEDLRDAMKAGDKQLSDAIADKIIALEDITQKELRVSATTLSMTIWQALTPEATVFMVNRVVNDANKSKLGFESQQAEDFINKWNTEIPESVKRLLSENPELKDFINKIQTTVDKTPPSRRAPKAKAKEIANKVRSLKSSNWGLTFTDPVGATVILDGALELTAKTIETTGNILQGIQDGITEIKKSIWYKSLTSAKQKEVEKAFHDKIRKEIDFDASEYIEQQSWYTKAEKPEVTEEEKQESKEKQDARKAKREADKRLKDLIFDTIASHWLVEKTDGKSLTDRLVENVGLTKKEAEKIAEIAEEAVRRDSQKIFDDTIGKKISNKNTKKSAFEKFFNLIKRGALTNENYYQVFSKEYKLKSGLTSEEKTQLQKLAINAQLMSPYGYFGDIAFNEFAQYMAKVTEQDSWVGRQSRLMVAANYSRMLSGITTHKVNLTSAGMNLLIRPFFGTLNPIKWGMTGVSLLKGNTAKAHLQNPLAALTYALGAYRRGMEIGGTNAINIVRSGNVKEASKYMESVNNLNGQKIPELEKNTFGVGKRFKPWDLFEFKIGNKTFLSDINPWNAMKYSGRTLLAEDSAMFNTAFALELAMATRKKLIESGKFESIKDLKGKILNEIVGENLTEEQTKNIESQLEEQVQMLRATGVEPTPMQVKQRRFELTRTLLELSPETIEETTQLARDAIFTNDRGGVFSIIGDAMGNFFGKHILIKMATMPKIPFTGVLGRIADMGLDTSLGYGMVRAQGWSPTGIIARARQWHKTGQFSDFMTSPAKAGLFKSAQMGERGSELYERQMARAYFGLTTLATIASVFLTSDDDDKDEDGNPRIDITGGLHYHDYNEKEQHYMGAYTAKIGRFKIRYLNFPILNMPFAMIGNYKDAIKAGEVNDEFMAKFSLMGAAWFRSLGLIKDTWLAKGINDMFELIGGVIATFGGDDKGRKKLKEEDDKAIIEIDKRIQRQLETLRDDYTGLAIKYIDPLKSNLLQQAIKFTTPEGRLKGTGLQLWAYNAGLQWWNDKRTDIFGQEVKTLPGDQGTAWPREDDKRWQKMWEYNIHIQDVTPKDKLLIKGVPQTLEWDKYIERKGLIQDLFKDKFDAYFDSYSEKQLEKKADTYSVDPLSGVKTNEVDSDVRKIWSDTKEQVDRYLFVWDKQVSEDKKLFDALLKEGVLPEFYTPRIETKEGERILIPYDKLIKMNDETMKNFIPNIKAYLEGMDKESLSAQKERIKDKKTGETNFQYRVKWLWDRANNNPESNLKRELGVW